LFHVGQPVNINIKFRICYCYRPTTQ